MCISVKVCDFVFFVCYTNLGSAGSRSIFRHVGPEAMEEDVTAEIRGQGVLLGEEEVQAAGSNSCIYGAISPPPQLVVEGLQSEQVKSE